MEAQEQWAYALALFQRIHQQVLLGQGYGEALSQRSYVDISTVVVL